MRVSEMIVRDAALQGMVREVVLSWEQPAGGAVSGRSEGPARALAVASGCARDTARETAQAVLSPT